MSSYPIQPVTRPQPPIVIDHITIWVYAVVLGECASMEVNCYDSLEKLVGVERLTLSQPEYSDWGSDDEWLVDWVFTQLGFSHPSV
jgi:hypothetical protein